MLTTEIDTIARQLSEVNNSERITHKFKFKRSEWGSQIERWEEFYDDMNKLLRVRNVKLGEWTHRTDGELREETPGSDFSGFSLESDKEHVSQDLANHFLYASLKTLEGQLKDIAWYPADHKVMKTCVRRGCD